MQQFKALLLGRCIVGVTIISVRRTPHGQMNLDVPTQTGMDWLIDEEHFNSRNEYCSLNGQTNRQVRR